MKLSPIIVLRCLFGTLARCMLVITLASGPVGAHEFWITPSVASPTVGEPIAFQLSVGDGFTKAEPFPRDPEHLDRFWAHFAGREVSLPGLDGARWVGAVRPTAEGPLIVAYSSQPVHTTLGGAQFDRYLVEEGLVAAQRLRLERDEVGLPATESFRRCAKLIQGVRRKTRVPGEVDLPRNPAPPPTGFDRSIGLELEIILETSPALHRPGAPFILRVERNGKPAAGQKVRAQCEGSPRLRVSARTDAEGRTTLALPQPGFWLFSTVAMDRCGEESEADWASVWSSLTVSISQNYPTSGTVNPRPAGRRQPTQSTVPLRIPSRRPSATPSSEPTRSFWAG